MLQRSSRASWICTRCLEQQSRNVVRRGLITSSRSNATAATASVIQDDHSPASHIDPAVQHDDRTLRQIFDSQPFWQSHSANSKHQYTGRNIGLFQNRYLTKPEGFQEFAAITLSKCQRIVAAVLEFKSLEEYKRIARDLDRLSDLLCRVIDLSDFVRSVHPDKRFQIAAHQAYSQMFEYMNVLNTTTGLNDQLKVAASTPEVWNSWSEEEKTVASILIRDFSKSAIDMQQADREAFVNISNEIADVGSTFVDSISAAKPYLNFQSSALMGMDPLSVKRLTSWGGKVTLPLAGSAPLMALRSVNDAEVRRDIYMAHRTSSEDNVHRLEQLLRRRAELARLSGFESYGHMTLSEKMAQSPEAVTSFLDAVARENTPRVKEELDTLSRLKQNANVSNTNLEPWDREYYTAKLMASLRSKSRAPDFLSAYFSLGTVMQGLSRMYHRLYGIRLVPREVLPGETWNSEVRRLDVIDDREGHIAVIYCDLFERAGKSPNPAHFTLRCSRKISQEEMQESVALSASSDAVFATAEEAASDGLATAINRSDENSLYQLPTIALICDFAINHDKKRPALLTFREVRTLFHEMGHALHSICGRTRMQNVAGTRCATDFAELPSVLNESFASAPEVLSLWARHWDTDEPLNVDRIHEKIKLERRMDGAEIESQVILGTLDQRYHSALPLSWTGQEFPSTAVYHDVYRQYSSIPEPHGTSWQGFFGHLFGYGATYYSYLFDRAIAGKIWKDVFQRTNAGALDPEAGHRYREEVLRWGGSRDGWACVGGLLGGAEGDIVSRGGQEAMKKVGTWGVRDSWG